MHIYQIPRKLWPCSLRSLSWDDLTMYFARWPRKVSRPVFLVPLSPHFGIVREPPKPAANWRNSPEVFIVVGSLSVSKTVGRRCWHEAMSIPYIGNSGYQFNAMWRHCALSHGSAHENSQPLLQSPLLRLSTDKSGIIPIPPLACTWRFGLLELKRDAQIRCVYPPAQSARAPRIPSAAPLPTVTGHCGDIYAMMWSRWLGNPLNVGSPMTWILKETIRLRDQ